MLERRVWGLYTGHEKLMSTFIDRIFPPKDDQLHPQSKQPAIAVPAQTPTPKTPKQGRKGRSLVSKVFPPKESPEELLNIPKAVSTTPQAGTGSQTETPRIEGMPDLQSPGPPATPPTKDPTGSTPPSKLPPTKRQSPAAAPVQQVVQPLPTKPHGRTKQLVQQREVALRDLGGLLFEMYYRDRFRKDLLDRKCAEIGRIDAKIRKPISAPSPPPNQAPRD